MRLSLFQLVTCLTFLVTLTFAHPLRLQESKTWLPKEPRLNDLQHSSKHDDTLWQMEVDRWYEPMAQQVRAKLPDAMKNAKQPIFQMGDKPTMDVVAVNGKATFEWYAKGRPNDDSVKAVKGVFMDVYYTAKGEHLEGEAIRAETRIPEDFHKV